MKAEKKWNLKSLIQIIVLDDIKSKKFEIIAEFDLNKYLTHPHSAFRFANKKNSYIK